jgi:hypothetical protein
LLIEPQNAAHPDQNVTRSQSFSHRTNRLVGNREELEDRDKEG